MSKSLLIRRFVDVRLGYSTQSLLRGFSRLSYRGGTADGLGRGLAQAVFHGGVAGHAGVGDGCVGLLEVRVASA